MILMISTFDGRAEDIKPKLKIQLKTLKRTGGIARKSMWLVGMRL